MNLRHVFVSLQAQPYILSAKPHMVSSLSMSGPLLPASAQFLRSYNRAVV